MKISTSNNFKNRYRSFGLITFALISFFMLNVSTAVAQERPTARQERPQVSSNGMNIMISQNEGLVVIDADGSSNSEAKLTIRNASNKVVYVKAVKLRGQLVSIHVPTAQLGSGNEFTAKLVSRKFTAEQAFQLGRK